MTPSKGTLQRAAPATRQLQDPAANISVYSSTIAIVVVAMVSTIASGVPAVLADGAHAALMILAIVLLGFAGTVVIVAANPFRAPFTFRAHLVAILGMLLAVVAATSSTWSIEYLLWRDNWVPLAVGVILVAINPYRPARELIAAGTLIGLVAAGILLMRASNIGGDAALALAVGTMASVCASCFGGAAFSAATIRALQRRQRRGEVAADALAGEMRAGIAQSVRRDSLTILESEVAPFFTQVLSKPNVTADDRARAAAIADSIRRTMVAESDRTWLDTAFGHPAGNARAAMSITDSEGLAAEMDAGQRTVLRTLVAALAEDPDASKLAITLARDGQDSAGVLTVRVDAPESAVRGTYGAYFAVMRVAFDAASFDFDHPYLIVRFSYERP